MRRRAPHERDPDVALRDVPPPEDLLKPRQPTARIGHAQQAEYQRRHADETRERRGDGQRLADGARRKRLAVDADRPPRAWPRRWRGRARRGRPSRRPRPCATTARCRRPAQGTRRRSAPATRADTGAGAPGRGDRQTSASLACAARVIARRLASLARRTVAPDDVSLYRRRQSSAGSGSIHFAASSLVIAP